MLGPVVLHTGEGRWLATDPRVCQVGQEQARDQDGDLFIGARGR